MALGPNDIYIPVMGMTGSGKSNFVNLCTGGSSAQSVGHGLVSFTQTTTKHTLNRHGKTIHLLDTPGFGDTNRSDADVLTELAFWLSEASKNGLRIAGVVYIHSILSPRLYGSAAKGLSIFKKIVGSQAYGAVVMLTTHWDAVRSEHLASAGERQKELECGPWSDILNAAGGSGGCSLGLGAATEESALSVLDRILRANGRFTLQLQHEMDGQGIELRDTGAGKILFQDYDSLLRLLNARMAEVSKELQEAARERDERQAADLKRELAAIRQDTRRQTDAMRELSKSMRDVSARQMQEAEHQRAKLALLVLETKADLSAQADRQQRLQQYQFMQQTQLSSQSVVASPPQPQASSQSVSNAIGTAAGVASAVFAGAALCTLM